jgi:oligopeptide/dipeptide ABC transporter ATP-binding protein
MTALLQLQRAGKVFTAGLLARTRTVALDDVTLSIRDDPPAILGIAGESGSGKTTLFRLLLGTIAPSDGAILYRGRDLRRLGRAERLVFRREVQPIFQDPFEVYNPFYRVDHCLRVPVARFRLARSRAEADALIRDAMERVGLRPDEILGRFPHELSGGQRQRVMAARALVLRPRAILADEPVSMVDASLRATVLESLRRLYRELAIPLVYITHDLTTAYQLCDHLIVLYRGRVVEAGAVGPLIEAPAHPYTRLLVDSIPRPDPSTRWRDEVVAQPEEVVETGDGCVFAARCPHVMPVCRREAPPLFRTAPDRAVRCFLHHEAPAMDAAADITQVFPSRSSVVLKEEMCA